MGRSGKFADAGYRLALKQFGRPAVTPDTQFHGYRLVAHDLGLIGYSAPHRRGFFLLIHPPPAG
jgi:hypothetical protein